MFWVAGYFLSSGFSFFFLSLDVNTVIIGNAIGINNIIIITTIMAVIKSVDAFAVEVDSAV